MSRATITDPVVIGNATLYLGDCSAVLPTIRADAIITDPPYGMDYNTDSRRFKGPRGGHKASWGGIQGDAEPFDPAHLLAFERVVTWGCNHYGARLPVGTTLVWIKRYAEAFGTFLSDAELAWMKGGHGVYCKLGPFPQSIASDREHPAQKPVALMEWCIQMAKVPTGGVVADPYMGSGTTGVACAGLGLPFVGVERDPKHFETAVSRIKAAHSQGRLFA